MAFNPNVPPMGTNPYQQMPFGYQQNMRYPYSQPNIGYTNQPLVYGYLMPPYVEMVNNHPMDFQDRRRTEEEEREKLKKRREREEEEMKRRRERKKRQNNEINKWSPKMVYEIRPSLLNSIILSINSTNLKIES